MGTEGPLVTMWTSITKQIYKKAVVNWKHLLRETWIILVRDA